MHLYYKPRINRCSSINLYIRTLVGKYNLQINWIAIIKCKGHNKVLTFMNTGDLLQKSGLHVFSTLRQQILQVLSFQKLWTLTCNCNAEGSGLDPEYGNTGCRVFKKGIQNWKDFCQKINIPKGNYWILQISKIGHSFRK